MVKIRLIRQLLIANFNLFNIEINKYQTVFLKLPPPGTILKQNYILVFPAWCCSRDFFHEMSNVSSSNIHISTAEVVQDYTYNKYKKLCSTSRYMNANLCVTKQCSPAPWPDNSSLLMPAPGARCSMKTRTVLEGPVLNGNNDSCFQCKTQMRDQSNAKLCI